MAKNDLWSNIVQQSLSAGDSLLQYGMLRSQIATNRRAAALQNQQLLYSRFKTDLAMSSGYRAGVGAQQQAIGSSGIGGGSTGRLFDLQSQLSLQSARGSRDMEERDQRAATNIALAAARDSKVSGLASTLLGAAGSAIKIWG